jgi:cephalosporin hydroxylase
LVPVERYLVVQDTPVGGILAIYDFVAANDKFEIDKLRERLSYTVNVNGFLKRVK